MEKKNKVKMKLSNGQILVRTKSGIRIYSEKDHARTHGGKVNYNQDGRGK